MLSAPKSQRFLRFAIAMPIATPEIARFPRQETGGECGPAASTRPPPGQRLESCPLSDGLCGKMCFLSAMLYGILSVNLSVLCYVGSCSHEPAKSWAEVLFWGSRFMLVKVFLSSVGGAVSRDGVSLGLLGVPVPTTSPQKSGAAHGPRHPEFIDSILPVKLSCFLFWALSGLGFFSWIFGCSGRTNLMYGGFALQVLVLVGFVSVLSCLSCSCFPCFLLLFLFGHSHCTS